MPPLHRYIGNPILSGLLRLMFHDRRVRDVHCGLRAIRRDTYRSLRCVTTGMEFASEMVVRAIQNRRRHRPAGHRLPPPHRRLEAPVLPRRLAPPAVPGPAQPDDAAAAPRGRLLGARAAAGPADGLRAGGHRRAQHRHPLHDHGRAAAHRRHPDRDGGAAGEVLRAPLGPAPRRVHRPPLPLVHLREDLPRRGGHRARRLRHRRGGDPRVGALRLREPEPRADALFRAAAPRRRRPARAGLVPLLHHGASAAHRHPHAPRTRAPASPTCSGGCGAGF